MGSSSGIRVVLGWWVDSPWGEFADAMVERADGHRVLLAPNESVADLVSSTYTFDEVRVEPFGVTAAGGQTWAARSPSLELDLTVGRRTGLGRALRLVPRAVATSPALTLITDPVARSVLDGVRTRGVARPGRREYYGATDVHGVTAMSGRLDGIPLGELAPVDPPTRFGFSSTPRRPSVTEVVTTIVDTA